MFRKFLFVLAAGAMISMPIVYAQTSAPVTVQPAGSNPAPVKSAAPTIDSSAWMDSAMTSLRQMKAANEDTIKRQEAMLAKLDELQQAAEQIKIFSKRG